MKPLKIFIVDDEPSAIEVLELMLGQIEKTKIVGTAQSVVSAVKKIKQQPIDLLFLDVNLPDGTGFDILELLGQIDFKVVFFTAYGEYAIEAIKTKAFDYLMKPVGLDELEDCINRVQQSVNQANSKSWS